MSTSTRKAGRQPGKMIQVFASAPEFDEIAAALGFSDFDATAAQAGCDADRPGQPIVASIVSDAVAEPIELCRGLPPGQPVVLLASDVGFDLRLAAARVGVRAILKRPLDPIELLRCLKELDATAESDPLSVVLVDDDRLTADINAAILSAAAIDVVVVDNPRVAVEVIERVLPDLVLMDLCMPGVDGVELAQAVRLSRELMAIPIVFLSAEGDEGRQSAARRVGGDDFIQKPVDPRKFATQIKLRANRAKALRAMGERDGLTGLLDHSRFRERVTHEVSHCRRHGGELSLAIIDVDRFKAVNDRYGHLVGDQVLRTFAQLLTATLRVSDIVGRCGGEEFGVLLRNTDAHAAWSVIDKLRERFGSVPFAIGDDDLTVTVSAGVASNEGRNLTSTDLLMAADRALYIAKATGRDKVLRDEPSPVTSAA